MSDILTHQGVKGMKWGVRKDNGHVGETAKTKKIAKLDKKFDRNSQTLHTTVKLHNRAAQLTNDNDVERINNKPAYKKAIDNDEFLRDTPLRQKYYKEHQDAFLNNLEKAATEFGTNASGTKKYSIVEQPDGGWDVSVNDVKHSADPNVIMTVKVKYNAKKQIVKIMAPADESAAHGESFIDDFLSHYGVKGMHWGQHTKSSSRHEDRTNDGKPHGLANSVNKIRDRKKMASTTPTDVVVKTKPGARVKTAGGKNHSPSEDAIRTAKIKQQAKSSTIDSLSTKELRDLVDRMNLEQQYDRLNPREVGLGEKFAKSTLSAGGGLAAKYGATFAVGVAKNKYGDSADPRVKIGLKVAEALADNVRNSNGGNNKKKNKNK